MKILVILGLITLVSGAEVGLSTGNNNCTAEYMDGLLKQALQIKEECDLTGRYDCCKVCQQPLCTFIVVVQLNFSHTQY